MRSVWRRLGPFLSPCEGPGECLRWSFWLAGPALPQQHSLASEDFTK